MLSGKKLLMLKKRTLVLYCTLQHTVVRNRSSKQVICKEKSYITRQLQLWHKKL